MSQNGTDVHHMELVLSERDPVRHVFACLDCERVVEVTPDSIKPVHVLIRGDNVAPHSGTTGEIKIGRIQVKPEDED